MPPIVSMKDPRSYIKAVPLPIPPQTGIKIQARSSVVFNPTEPPRDDVRKQHYQRRLVQMTQQGFRSLIHKPYQGIGDPFYLDQKKLILHALGQWEEGQELETSSSSESEDDHHDNDNQRWASKNNSTANFVLRRTRKDLNTLGNEISHARNRIRNVRLGHGLFQLVRKEREEKTSAKMRAERKSREAELNEWQPAKTDSEDDDETDDELIHDVDLRSFMVTYNELPREDEHLLLPPSSPQLFLTEGIPDPNRSRVAFQGLDGASSVCSAGTDYQTKSIRSGVSQRSRSSRRKKPPPRPYTPQHSNIGGEHFSWPDKLALFRQLSALHWLLEAMNLDQNSGNVMGPIMTCWNLKEIGGHKMAISKQQDLRKSEKKWHDFIANPHEGTRRHGVGRLSTRTTPRKHSMGRNSISNSNSPAGSTSQLNYLSSSSGGNTRLGDVPEEGVMSQKGGTGGADQDEDDKAAMFRFLDDSYEHSVKEKEESSQLDGSSALSDASAVSHYGAPHLLRARKDKRRLSEAEPRRSSVSPPKKLLEDDFIKHLESINRSDEDPRLHALANPREKMSSKEYRADVNIRPKSTPAVMEYKSMLPSNKKGSMTSAMRQRFAMVTEEKAMMLHDALEAKERKRLRVLQNKFIHMPTGGSSFYRALIDMRKQCVQEEENREKQRRSSVTHLPWFMELVNNIPDDVKRDWYFQEVLDQLSKHGRIDSGKQSAYKFLEILSGLRDWEVCSPDISAAIEFCREKIVDMNIEEYEEWFQQQFPAVVRPHTAPPALRNGSDSTKVKPKVKPKVPKSAPPAGRRTVSINIESPAD